MMPITIADLSNQTTVSKTPLEDWEKLARLPNEVLGQLDIADVHLRCLLGLPEAKWVNKSACLKRLDEWAGVVQRWTKLAIPEFYQKKPAEYGHSEAFFRAFSLVSTLQRHCGVHADQSQKALGPKDPFKLECQFIHGIIQGLGGNCASLPIVYTAVGRRLALQRK